jgi:hypothetical protein
MVKTNRKKKKPTKKTALSGRAKRGFSLPPEATRFPADKAIMVTQEMFIETGAPSCFELLMKRLEKPNGLDPIILDAKLIYNTGRWVGTAIRLTLKLDDRKLKSPAIITTYKHDSTLSWVLTGHPKVKEYWHLEPKPGGTIVHFTFGMEIPGSMISRFFQKIVQGKKISQKAHEMLMQLKKVAEATYL